MKICNGGRWWWVGAKKIIKIVVKFQKLMKWCHFWIQKLLKNINFWIQISAKWTFYLLDPEIDEMPQFLDPEIVEKHQFLDPEIAKLDTIYFWIQKLMIWCNFWIQNFFLDPEIVKMVNIFIYSSPKPNIIGISYRAPD